MNGATVTALWLALLAVWLLLRALSLLLTTLNCMRLRLRPAEVSLLEREAMAPESRAVLDAMQPELQALGFARVASLRTGAITVMQPQLPADADLYRHASGRAWAVAVPHVASYTRTVGGIEWLSCFADGSNWVGTVNSMDQFLAPPPGWTYFDDAQRDTAAAWQAYAERLAATDAPVIDDAGELARRLSDVRRATIAQLLERRQAVPAGDDCWRLTWREALRMAWRLLRRQRKLMRAARRAGPSAAPDPAPIRALSETLGFERIKAARAAFSAAHRRRRTFWVTAALFMLVGAAVFSWRLALMLLAVVALHEGGHWLAMRWFGYRRQSVFFIPALGAVAMGEKADATPLQKLAVYLAGPVPGILLALAGLAWMNGLSGPPPAWALTLALIGLLVNAFNLLPVLPLDGGRVLETLLFQRLPALRFVFALAGVGALAALAWLMRDPVITGLAILLLFTLPWHWRVMRLERAVRRAYPDAAPVDAPTATRRLFAVLQQPAFARWPFVQRTLIVRSLLPALQSRPPRWGETALGLLIYLACLALPLAAVVAGGPQVQQVLHEISARWGGAVQEWDQARYVKQELARIDADLARAGQLPEARRVDAYLEAASDLSDLGEETPAVAKRARSLYQQIWALVRERAPHDEQRAQTLLGLADTAEKPEQAVQWRQQLVADLQGAPGRLRLLLADAQQALVSEPPPGQTRAERLALLQQAVENRQAESRRPDDYALLNAREQLARVLDRSGDAPAAQAQLAANVLTLTDALRPDGHWAGEKFANDRLSFTLRLMAAETLQAWFLIDHGQSAAALALARQAAARIATPALRRKYVWTLSDSLRAQLWAAIEQDDAAAVREALRQQEQAFNDLNTAWQRREASLDRLAAAQALGDDALRQRALQALQPQPSPLGQCRPDDVCRPLPPRSDLQTDWQDRARARQSAAATAAGLCPASAANQ